MPSLLIVDDNLLVRQGLKQLLRQQHRGLVLGEAGTSEEAFSLLVGRTWDVVVIDLSLPNQDGLKMLQEIRKSHPAAKVFLLSQHANPGHASQARQMQAYGYAGKNSPRAELLQAFRSVLDGKPYFVGLVEESLGVLAPLHASLSSRELDVLRGCVQGKRVNQIAGEMELSGKTVSTYKRRILDKLELNSVAELVRYAIEHKLV
jgi:DNA-binding NarL/FixJ family response regulator